MNADDFAELSNLSLSMPDGESSAQHRTKFRIMAEGVSVRLTWPERADKGLDSFDVNDISAGGLYMKAPEGMFAAGQSIILDVLVLGRCCVGAIKAHVVRSSKNGCAVAFEELSRNQELRLDKIVLEMQKRGIAQSKKNELEADARRAREMAASAEYGSSDTSCLKSKL